MIFAIPRGDTVYIGTTDTKFEHGKDKLHVLESEVEYLIESVKNTFSISMDKKDIISSWVGLRPLVKDGNKKVHIKGHLTTIEQMGKLSTFMGFTNKKYKPKQSELGKYDDYVIEDNKNFIVINNVMHT